MFGHLFIFTALAIAIVFGQAVAEKNWVVNFKSGTEVTDDNFDAVEQWISTRNGKVIDKLNSPEFKVMMVQMGDNIRDLLTDEEVGKFVDSIDDDEEFEHDDL